MNGPSRRLLMIARHFPPLNVSGAARVESFARYLPAAGWTVTVVSARDQSDGTSCPAKALPVGCNVVRAFSADTKDVFSISGRYPALLAFPDRNAPWIVDGIRQALRCCRRERFDAILSTSPVVSAHCIGFATKWISGLPWVIDLRDPWNHEAPFGRFLSSLDDRLERFLLGRADAITVTTPGMIEEIARERGSRIGRKIHLVRNGYDEELLRGVTTPSAFRIVHAGDTTNRDPADFLRALRLCLDRGTLPGDACVELIGSEQDTALQETVGAFELSANVRSTPRVAHAAALDRLAGAAGLLLIQSRPVHRLSIPAKSYEYLRSGRMILAITDEDSETGRLLQGHAGVWIAPPGDVERIAASLEDLHAAWKADPGKVFQRDVSSYTRRRQAEELARLLDRLTGDAAESRP